LPDSNVNTDSSLPFLVKDRIDCYGCLAGLAVTNDEFPLAAPDRIIESIALMPVWTGVSTSWRSTRRLRCVLSDGNP